MQPVMSRAFVNEDAGGDQDPRFSLPDPDSPLFPEAAAWALMQGADAGDSRSAEIATGYVWGDRRLIGHVEAILEQARERDETRLQQLARRFLRRARSTD
jgi:hypothetical protein